MSLSFPYSSNTSFPEMTPLSLSTCAVLLSEDACSSVRVTSICWSGCPRPRRSLALISAKYAKKIAAPTNTQISTKL